MIGAGYLMAWSRYLGEDQFDALMKFAQGLAVPCLLFTGVARLDIGESYDGGLFLSFYIGAFAGFALGFLGARHIFGRPPEDSVAIGFCCLFSNSLLLGLALTERAYGPDALAANLAIISIHAPLFYAFGITVMEVVRGRGHGLPARAVAAKVLRAILTNALVIGILLGFAVNVAGDPLPAPVWSAVDMIARTGLPAALFALGGILYRYRPEGDRATIAMVVLISLVVHPAITWALGRGVFGLTVDQLRSAVVTGAMAPGINAYLFANMYGVARRVAASSVLIGTALSVLTAWGWLAILP